jgi:hypothetical protein
MRGGKKRESERDSTLHSENFEDGSDNINELTPN